MSYDSKPFEAFAVGDKATFSKTIGEADIVLFAAVSGDNYPVHVDEEYAKTTRFGRRNRARLLDREPHLDHERIAAAKPGGISVAQTLRFLQPVYPGDTITACTEVIEIDAKKRRLRCRTTCTNQHGVLVVDGEALEQKDPA